jgi:hypothetical protein
VLATSSEYRNSVYGFSLTMPEGFEASELYDDAAESLTTLIQNDQGDGVQIYITPFDEDTGAGYTLTRERILQDIPDMQIKEEQVVEIGENYKGLAFLADDTLFGGESRAVWFVYRGNLYQINTYARLDQLLKNIFATWQFF